MQNDIIMKILVEGADEASRQIDKLTFHFDRFGKLTDKEYKQLFKLYKIEKSYEKEMDILSGKTRKFNAQWLSLMFAGMQLSRTMDGLIKTSLDWAGTNEIVSDAMGLLFLPTALQMTDWAIKFFDAVSKLPDPIKDLVGVGALGADVFGKFLAWLGQAKLGWDALKSLWEKHDIVLNFLRSGWDDITAAWTFITTFLKDKIYEPIIKFVRDSDAWKMCTDAWDNLKVWEKGILIAVGFIIAADIGTQIGTQIGKLGEQWVKSFDEGTRKAWAENMLQNPVWRFLGLIGTGVTGGLQTIFAGGADPAVLEAFRNLWYGINPQAEGGIVTRPTLATVGEAGPEAIIPLDKAGFGTFAPYINVNATINSQMDLKNLASKLSEYMYDEWRAKSFGR